MSEIEILELANKIVAPHGLRAEFIGDFLSVGVGGDNRTYTKIMVILGLWSGHEVLASLSTEISNRTGINRITFQITPPGRQ